MTRIQLALDTGSTSQAVRVATAAVDNVDIIEAGTILILNDGLGAVSELRRVFPKKPVVADIRIGRAGRRFAELAFQAGASAVTVLGETPLDVVVGAVAAASEYAGSVEVELPTAWEQKDVTAWGKAGVTSLIAHSADTSAAAHEEVANVLRRLSQCDLLGMAVTLAGGFAAGDSKRFAGVHFDTVAVGSAIVKAADPAAAAAQLRAELNTRE